MSLFGQFIESYVGNDPKRSQEVREAMEPVAPAVAETGATISTSMLAESMSGLGMLGAATGLGSDIPNDPAMVRDTLGQALTYQPRTEAGQGTMDAIGQGVHQAALATGLDKLPPWWRETGLPATQRDFGDKAGSALGAGLVAILSAGMPPPARRLAHVNRELSFDDMAAMDRGKHPRVFHGSEQQFLNPDPRYGQLGNHFGTLKAARNFTDHNIVEGHLAMTKPLRLHDLGNWSPGAFLNHYQDPVSGDVRADFRAAEELGFNGPPEMLEDLVKVAERHHQRWVDGDAIANGPFNSHHEFTREMDEVMDQYGFDGIVYSNKIEDAGSDSYIATRPNTFTPRPLTNREVKWNDDVNPEVRNMIDSFAEGREPVFGQPLGDFLKTTLTPTELNMLTPAGVRSMETAFRNMEEAKRSPHFLSILALKGADKRGWYQSATKALASAFGHDAPAFVGVLAATSPRTSVKQNLINASKVWRSWIDAGRPTDLEGIDAAIAASGIPKMDAYVGNVKRALRAAGQPDSFGREPATRPVSMIHGNTGAYDGAVTDEYKESLAGASLDTQLSGPKVDSFMLNLLGESDEVTLDTWMAIAAGLNHADLGGTGKVAFADDIGELGVKSPTYLALNAMTRAATDKLNATLAPGDARWTPAEVQETVWSWIKAATDKANSKGETRTPGEMLGSDMSKEVLDVPDFATLMQSPEVVEILKPTVPLDKLPADKVAAARTRADNLVKELYPAMTPDQQAKKAEAFFQDSLEKMADDLAPDSYINRRGWLELSRISEAHRSEVRANRKATARSEAALFREEPANIGRVLNKQYARTGVFDAIRAVRPKLPGAGKGSRSAKGSNGGPAGRGGLYRARGAGSLAGDVALPSELVGEVFSPRENITAPAKLRGMGKATPDIAQLQRGPESAAVFHEAISAARDNSDHGASVHLYSPEEYAEMDTYLTPDGTSGFALKDGDIVSVFNNKQGPHSGVSASMVALAIQQGGNRLDAFDGPLVFIYSQLGFRPVSRVQWSDAHKPQGWDKSKVKTNGGEPDVIMMVYDPHSKNDAVLDPWFGSYDDMPAHLKKKRNAMLHSPDGYDEALSRQMGALDQMQLKPNKREPGMPGYKKPPKKR